MPRRIWIAFGLLTCLSACEPLTGPRQPTAARACTVTLSPTTAVIAFPPLADSVFPLHRPGIAHHPTDVEYRWTLSWTAPKPGPGGPTQSPNRQIGAAVRHPQRDPGDWQLSLPELAHVAHLEVINERSYWAGTWVSVQSEPGLRFEVIDQRPTITLEGEEPVARLFGAATAEFRMAVQMAGEPRFECPALVQRVRSP